MNDPRLFLAASLLLMGGAGFILSRRALASVPEDVRPDADPPADEGVFSVITGAFNDVAISTENTISDLGEFVSPTPNADQNIAAFLSAVSVGEGTATANGYRYLFGSRPGNEKLFSSFDDHPRVRTYEVRDEFIKNGKRDYTTAAGRYQITETTFNRLQKKLGTVGFSPDVQDRMAIELIRERGALADVRAGRYEQAVLKLRQEWASLPGSPYGQPTKTLTAFRSAYEAAGGAVA